MISRQPQRVQQTSLSATLYLSNANLTKLAAALLEGARNLNCADLWQIGAQVSSAIHSEN